jgi:hypothetical protein
MIWCPYQVAGLANRLKFHLIVNPPLGSVSIFFNRNNPYLMLQKNTNKLGMRSNFSLSGTLAKFFEARIYTSDSILTGI